MKPKDLVWNFFTILEDNKKKKKTVQDAKTVILS